MAYYAGNGIPVAPAWEPQATFPTQGWFQEKWQRFDVFANGTDVVAQLLEAPDSGWSDDQTQEILCPMGFHSIPTESPFVAIRFKVWIGTLLPNVGSVHFRLFS